MDHVYLDLFLLMVVVWSAAVLLRSVGLPTVMGELVMGILLGPAVLGWVVQVSAEAGRGHRPQRQPEDPYL